MPYGSMKSWALGKWPTLSERQPVITVLPDGGNVVNLITELLRGPGCPKTQGIHTAN